MESGLFIFLLINLKANGTTLFDIPSNFGSRSYKVYATYYLVCLFICLGFMAYQPFLVIQCQIHFNTIKQFYFKQFSLIVKNISISSYSVLSNSFNLNNSV